MIPRISIVTPSFNQGNYLEQCIDSILSQNYPNLEYIIMDGGSTDNSIQIIKKYEKYLTYWQSQSDDGHYSAVNEGFRLTTGDILCWLNSDDMFHPAGLFTVADVFARQAEIDFITGKRVGFDGQGKLLSYGHEHYVWSRERLLDTANIDKHLFVMQEATFWRRSLWELAGGTLDLSFDLAADFELWCRFSRYTRLHTVDALLGGYRYHGLEQRSQQYRDEYIAQCKAIIERELSTSSAIHEHDLVPPLLVSLQGGSELQQIMVKKPFPAISIVTPSFNQGEFLEECIDSVLSQNYPSLEYIIMDGGSTDGSVDIIKKYANYLTYWQSQPDGGQYNAVNEGFKKTSGTIMAWLNSDDKYHRDAFFKVAYLFSQSLGTEWIVGRPTFWGKVGEFTHCQDTLPTYCRNDFLEGRYNQPFIQQESTFWKRSLWERAGGGLKTDLDYAGDLELWVRFFRHALLYSVDTFLGGYRSHGNQKAVLFMDRYDAEAEIILAEENKKYPAGGHPAAPTPLAVYRSAYRDFLTGVCDEHTDCAPSLLAAAEDAMQFMLRRVTELQGEVTRQSSDNTAAAAQIAAAESQARLAAIQTSLSWRITKPLRWLGDKIRGE